MKHSDIFSPTRLCFPFARVLYTSIKAQCCVYEWFLVFFITNNFFIVYSAVSLCFESFFNCISFYMCLKRRSDLQNCYRKKIKEDLINLISLHFQNLFSLGMQKTNISKIDFFRFQKISSLLVKKEEKECIFFQLISFIHLIYKTHKFIFRWDQLSL